MVLDDSIEILRGDNQPKKKSTTSRKGRGRKKLEPEVISEGDQKGTKKSGETTEIMRSTHGIKQGKVAENKQLEQFRVVTDVTSTSGNHLVTSQIIIFFFAVTIKV